ncbi:mitochondrial antiviral-signaling protein isoform X2 [Rhea pennata]|uniref:mitochondrial antiviral-signaling protein isoform X2 n=1 Tax=Rhea pennata TaxID=8795 RepID=UPI002E25A563
MGFAEDKVYDHILRNLSNFGNIHVTSLAHSLTCLTEADRDELQAREEMRGRHTAVFKLYQFLKCRRGWVPDLINALHQNNAGHLAEELQQLYDFYRIPGGAPSSSVSARMPSVGANPAPGAPRPEQPRREPPAGSQPSLLPGAATAASSAAASTDLDSRAPVQESLPKELPERESPPPPGSVARDGASEGLRGEGSLPLGDPSAARRNEPEEVHYVSAELPPRPVEAVHVGEPRPPDSLKTPACGSGPGEPPSSFVDVRNPLLIQKEFDAEQKRLGMLRSSGGDGDAQVEAAPPVSAPAPTATFTSSGASLKAPVQEGKLAAGERAGSAPSIPTKERVLPASAAPFLGTTAVGSFEGTAGRRTPLVSSAGNMQVFRTYAEEDVELSKPGVLLSAAGGNPEGASRCLSSRWPSSSYSGDSDRLELSSDSLMLSTDSLSHGEALSRAPLGCWTPAPVAHADPAGEKATAANPCPPPSTSLVTHEVRVDHYPSVLLGAPQDLPQGDSPFRNPPAFDSSTNSNLSQAKVVPRDSNSSSWSYIAPAAGIALISAVAFLVYARLQK